MPSSADTLNAITSDVIEAAVRIHRSLGPGLLESAYLACLAYELHHSGRRIDVQRSIPLVYKEVRIDCAYRADLIVDGEVLVEIKASESTADVHLRQLRTYLQIANCRVGLLLNFGAATMKMGIKRVVNRFPDE